MLGATLCLWVPVLIEIEEGEEEAPQGDGRTGGRVLEAEDQHDGRTGPHRELAKEPVAAVLRWNSFVLARCTHHKVNGDLTDLAHRVVP